MRRPRRKASKVACLHQAHFAADLGATELEAAGYRVATRYPTDDGSTHFLHVERIEHHPPTSLHARNTEFYGLAERHGLESYDGMDVVHLNHPGLTAAPRDRGGSSGRGAPSNMSCRGRGAARMEPRR
jgi:Regulator of ribonuclease activity B